MTGPLAALTQAFVKSFNFSGRSSRSEFWWVALFVFLIYLGAALADVVMTIDLIQTSGEAAVLALRPFDFICTFVALVTFVPLLSLSIRRLHDAGFSGFWWLVNLVPVVGQLVLLVIFGLPSDGPATVRAKTQKTPPATGKAKAVDAHKRAMQGYAVLFNQNAKITPEMEAARKAEISDYYRSRVLKPSASA